MPSFLLSFLASLLATFAAILVVAAISGRARKAFIAAISSLLGIDIENVFADPRLGYEDLQRELARTKNLYLLAGRGLELQKDQFAVLLRNKKKKLRILLADADAIGVNWMEIRERELAVFDRAYGDGLIATQLRAASEFLRKLIAEEGDRIECRLFNAPVFGRFIMTDYVVYFHPYRSDAHGSETPLFKYRRGGEMYSCLRRLFLIIWDQSPAI